jgi:hypothetical protein
MMATPPSDSDIGRITTQEIGILLNKEFPDATHGNVSIDYFYVQLRKEHVKKLKHDPKTAIKNLIIRQTTGITEIKKVMTGRKWPSTYFVKFPSLGQSETLREWEKRLDDKFRQPLKRAIEQKLREKQGQGVPEKPPVAHIIITRVCKYTHHEGGFEDEDGTDSD